ncbi:hypothetical protein GF325_02125 [Candidatus Bathyarchaeota archaeon]|nr:hypothetical protein [Candidatus Bathyarchaeota archaeon]
MLEMQEIHTGGRPKHLYRLSAAGMKRLLQVKQQLHDFFTRMQEEFAYLFDENFSVDVFLDNANFTDHDPLDHILERDIPIDEKIEHLESIEQDLEQALQRVRELKEELIK